MYVIVCVCVTVCVCACVYDCDVYMILYNTEFVSVYVSINVCVHACMSIYGGDDDRQIGGRCIIGSCPVARITAILASTSPFCAALKRGPSDILFVGPYADIVDQKWYAPKKSRFVDHTSVCIKQAH